MSAQEDTQSVAPNPFGASQVTMDQMEEIYKDVGTTPAAPVPEPPAPDDLPEQFKGKSVKEIVAHAEALQRAMAISEQGRVAAMRQMQGPTAQAAPAPPAPKEYTREELAEMMGSDDPNVRLSAVDILSTQAIRRAEAQVTARFGQLAESTVSSAELEARRMYPKEFELFGDQIYSFANAVPDRAQLGSVNQWRNIISFVRGMDENVVRYAQALGSGNGSPPPANAYSARAVESASAGFSPAPLRTPSNARPITLDAFTIEIAKAFGRDPMEYAREIAALDK